MYFNLALFRTRIYVHAQRIILLTFVIQDQTFPSSFKFIRMRPNFATRPSIVHVNPRGICIYSGEDIKLTELINDFKGYRTCVGAFLI